ncbi:MAG: ThuA domain-containing protein [Gammaproteobacteria bacterium]|nr:ThuA domain-containing protein [Gammaproteobacteria bacterium]
MISSPKTFSQPLRVIVWSEGTEPKTVYPKGINGAIGDFLAQEKDLEVTTATLTDDDYGVSQSRLNRTDVLIWFGHKKHDEIPDEVADRIKLQVENKGMKLIALHSSHFSKAFKSILNHSGAWADYRDTGESETIKIVDAKHPIAEGVSDFIIPHTEIYDEPFQVPEPQSVIAKGTWVSGSTSREIMTWTVGKGSVVYIRAGHEDYPIFFMPPMQRLITNAVYWKAQ